MKKKILLIITLILLLVPAFIFLVPIKDGRTFYKNIKYKQLLAGAIQPENYNKMKISYAQIKERKTGTAPFNTESRESVEDGSVLSNNDGVDVSAVDNYVRTGDRFYYNLEVGIERNELAADESFYAHGGVIFIKVKINPEHYEFVYHAWMQNVGSNIAKTEYTVQYHIPANTNPIGGNQLLTFEFFAGNHGEELSESDKPQFEVWMEGNVESVDNNVAPIIVNDPNDLKITSTTAYTIELSSGKVNYRAERNGIVGNYISFELDVKMDQPYSYIDDYRGLELPTADITSKLEFEYQYKKNNTSTGWITLDDSTPEGAFVLNNIELVAAGVLRSPTENFMPNEKSNIPVSSHLGVYKGGMNDYQIDYNSGSVFLEYNNGISFITNSNYYYKGDLKATNGSFIFDGIEFFFPCYDPENNYSYQIILKGTNVSGTVGNETYSIDTNARQIATFKNQVSGNVNFNMYGDQNSFDITSFVPGERKSTRMTITAASGPYLGGVETLLTWDTSKVRYDFHSLRDGWSNHSETGNYIVKYGVWKNDIENGLKNDDDINAAVYDDFNWYDSAAEAEENGRLSALYFLDFDNIGLGNQETLYVGFIVPNDADPSEFGMIRRKIKLYLDEDRTEFASFGYNQSYIKAVAENGIVQSGGTPDGYGDTVAITAHNNKLSQGIYNYYTGKEVTTVNVLDDYIEIKIIPEVTNIVDGYEDLKETFTIKAILPDGFNYIENSASIEPTEITTTPNYLNTEEANALIWKFENWRIGDPLPVISYVVDISPYFPNNYQKTFVSTMSSTGKFDGADRIGTKNGPSFIVEKPYKFTDISIISLAGQSIRKYVEKEYINPNEKISVNDKIYNISQETLNNVKTIHLLPSNNDAFGSSFHGTYTVKIDGLSEGARLYYTNKKIEELNISTDDFGRYLPRDLNLEDTSTWIEINSGETLPQTATILATYKLDLPQSTETSTAYTLYPTDNMGGDRYCLQVFGSSDNLNNAVISTINCIEVTKKSISGYLFMDENRNEAFEELTEFIPNGTVYLLDSNKNLLKQVTTDENGYYRFNNLEGGTYYIKYEVDNNYSFLPISSEETGNKVDETGVTPPIVIPNNTNNSEYNANVYIGYRKKPATLVVKYLDKNNDQPIADQTETTVYYTDNYETHGLTTIPENYSFLENAGAPVADIVNSDYIEVIYYYDYTPATVTARYYVDGTNTKVHEDVVQNLKLTKSYSTDQLTIQNYDYVRTDGDSTSGTVDKTEIVVNYYYKLKTGTVTTHHYLYDNGDTTTKLAPDVTKEWNYTETYTTSTSDQVPQNYEFYKKDGNFTAVMSSPSVEVSYYYRLKDSNLTTSITKTGDEEITAKNSEVNYTITYNAEVSEYIGDATITIVDTLPYAIDVDASNLDGGTYNATDKTITWTEDWTGIDSYNNNNQKTITKNIKLVYVGIVGRDRIMTNTTTGTITLSNNSREAQAQTSTNIRIKGKIKVIYIDEETNEELFDAIEEEKLVGEEFISSTKEKEGYKLVTKPDSETFEFEEEDQLITYGYERIKFEIKGKVLGVGGSIRGDEDVYWGEDSTEGNIIVEADEGYIIEAILINGEKMNIPLNQRTMILENFKEVLENKNIEVIFALKPRENPNTTNNFIPMIIIIVITAIIALSYRKLRIKKYQ